MAQEPCRLFDDPRPISGIYYPTEDGGCYRVGTSSVTAIVAYRENGQCDHVPFFAVYKGEHLAHRVPAQFVEVAYASSDTRPSTRPDAGDA